MALNDSERAAVIKELLAGEGVQFARLNLVEPALYNCHKLCYAPQKLRCAARLPGSASSLRLRGRLLDAGVGQLIALAKRYPRVLLIDAHSLVCAKVDEFDACRVKWVKKLTSVCAVERLPKQPLTAGWSVVLQCDEIDRSTGEQWTEVLAFAKEPEVEKFVRDINTARRAAFEARRRADKDDSASASLSGESSAAAAAVKPLPPQPQRAMAPEPLPPAMDLLGATNHLQLPPQSPGAAADPFGLGSLNSWGTPPAATPAPAAPPAGAFGVAVAAPAFTPAPTPGRIAFSPAPAAFDPFAAAAPAAAAPPVSPPAFAAAGSATPVSIDFFAPAVAAQAPPLDRMAHLFDALPPPQVEVSAADARGAATPDAFRPKLGEKKKAPADPFASLAKLG